jgi:ribonucleoside-diphosphate reductase alpha chain
VYRDGSRHEQVLHITGKNTGEKSFAVRPSRYVADYVQNGIKEPYVADQMAKILKESGVEDDNVAPVMQQQAPAPAEVAPKKMTQPSAMQVMSSNEDEVCPSCKSRLIITEGCNICIECGFSSCASG